MEIEFALDCEKSLIPRRTEGQSCGGLRLKVASSFSICSPSQLHAWAWFTGASGGEQECLCAQHPPQLSSQARLRPPTPGGAAEGDTLYGWMTVGLDGAQGLDSADANKNSSSCDLCPQSRFSHPESQCPGGAGKLSPDEATQAQREQGNPRSPCELVTELQVDPKPLFYSHF